VRSLSRDAASSGLCVIDDLKLADVVIALGGDGTILRAARETCSAGILGFNLGSLGYLSAVGDGDFREAFSMLAKGAFKVARRSMLEVRKCGSLVFSALNDIVITREMSGHAAVLEMMVNGRDATRYMADGLVVATPTGSTAYSLAAGGPIMAPSSDCLAVTPICPHSLTIKSFVVSAASIVTVMPEYKGHQVFLSPDGNTYELQEGDVVVIQRSQRIFSLLRIKGQGFYEIIRNKLANERTASK
jgi:NAD+ kinase